MPPKDEHSVLDLPLRDPPPPPASPDVVTLARRTWPALLVLVFLAPFTAEVLTDSTPILVYLTNPISFVYLPLLYGSGAVLIREVARRRGLGWASILLMGAAYGILEEGLAITSWTNPYWSDECRVVNGIGQGLCDYSRVGDVNLLWAFSLTIFHAVVSMTIPILLVGLMFPQRAARPWLGRKGFRTFVVALALAWGIGLLLFGILVFRKQGYYGPPLVPYLIEIALAVGLVALAIALGAPHVMARIDRPAPRLWLLRVLGFIAMFLYFLVPSVMQGVKAPYQATLATLVALTGLAAWRVATWARRRAWGERQMLALASGVLGFFMLVFDPIFEVNGQVSGKPTHGTLLITLGFLILLIVLARGTRTRASATTDAPALPAVA